MTWIPCSERMPPNTDLVIISTLGGDGLPYVHEGMWDGDAWGTHEWGHFYEGLTVSAWQPFPEAYKP